MASQARLRISPRAAQNPASARGGAVELASAKPELLESIQSVLLKRRLEVIEWTAEAAKRAKSARRMQLMFTIPTIILSAVASSSIIASDRYEFLRLAAAVMTVLVTILTAVAGVLSPSRIAAQERERVAQLGSVGRELHSLSTVYILTKPEEEALKALQDVEDRINGIFATASEKPSDKKEAVGDPDDFGVIEIGQPKF